MFSIRSVDTDKTGEWVIVFIPKEENATGDEIVRASEAPELGSEYPSQGVKGFEGRLERSKNFSLDSILY